MHVLIVGSGGREHVTAWKFAQSSQVKRLTVAPGNAGILAMSWNDPRVRLAPLDYGDDLLRFAQDENVDLTFVGPEKPLSAGLVDRFQAAGLRIFGPTQAAAQLESSKAYAKELMHALGVPVPEFRNFVSPEAARTYIRGLDYPVVVKADGLAAGKGSLVCDDTAQALQAVDALMVEKRFGDAGNCVVVEKRLYGREASFFCFTDGHTIRPMAWARDYKQAFDGDEGPNTGGMGGYSPNDEMDPTLVEKIMHRIALPLVHGLAEREGTAYRGILYIGLMLVEEAGELNPYVLEINVRMGDPEAQVIYPRLQTDLAEIAWACTDGDLDNLHFDWSDDHYLCVCATSGRVRGSKGWYKGYPGRYRIGQPISGLEEVDDDVLIFHAGTRWDEEAGCFRVQGGRVLAVVAGRPTLAEARRAAYREIEKIQFNGVRYRTDIGAR